MKTPLHAVHRDSLRMLGLCVALLLASAANATEPDAVSPTTTAETTATTPIVVPEPAPQQAAAAGAISRTMQVLREISTQTADSTTATSQSIAKLAELAAELRESASGFRLPATPARNESRA